MVAVVSQVTVVLLGLWLGGLGLMMMTVPRRALRALAAMGSRPLIHFGEMGLRALAGLALILAAEHARFPMALTVIGLFLMVSAAVLTLLPRRWHSAYSMWWAGHIPVWAVRTIGPLSVGMGGLLVWIVI